MNLEYRTDIQALYDLSSVCDDDLEVVAKLIHFLHYTPTKKLLNDLESLKVKKYESDINFLLDHMKIKTIKNLCELLHNKKKVGYK
ncbi:hypothetical protein CPG38_05730 [Malaciobacter marinus]|uniref:hypothetical protein n=1 Tax=Malaciobacter marinus TaxID=505249 RepID=UPI000C06CA7C|nr:hypothetical protein [Malaciobacter marinus]PHO12766.1 hypothetical protein CPG38_05730 [Malaciobacter marinus]